MLEALATAPRARGGPIGPTSHALQSDTTSKSNPWTVLLDEIDYGIVLVDPQGAIVHANRQARGQLRLEGLSSVWRCALCPVDSLAGRSLAHAVRQSAERGLRAAVQLCVAEESLVVSVIPLPLPLRAPSGGCLTLLLLQRPKMCTELALAGLAELHGLTDAEVGVLDALCDGRAAQGIAQRKGVALSTVRTQLQSLRSKLEVHSVRALLQLVGRLPPVMGALCPERNASASNDHRKGD